MISDKKISQILFWSRRSCTLFASVVAIMLLSFVYCTFFDPSSRLSNFMDNHDKIGRFSYHIEKVNVTIYEKDLAEHKIVPHWDWIFHGYIKDIFKIKPANPMSSQYTLSSGDIDATMFLKFRSDIGPELVQMVYIQNHLTNLQRIILRF